MARPLTSGSLEDGYNSAATAPVTIGANKLALLWVAQSDGAGGSPTLTDPHREWEVVTTTIATLQRLTLYRSMKNMETSGAVTVPSPGWTSVAWTLVEYGNVDTTGPNGAGPSPSSGPPTSKMPVWA